LAISKALVLWGLLSFASLQVAAELITEATLKDVLAIGKQAGVPKSVILQLMKEESQGNIKAVSREVKGYHSKGLFQLYEAPWNLGELLSKFWYAYEENWVAFDIFNPRHNAKVAMRYLAALHREYGSWYRALCFYNSGQTRLAPQETKAYALRIVNAR
jgi:soluble lytic murein transglycosylase-like protein